MLNLVELETDKGPAYVALGQIIAVGAAFKARIVGRPKLRVKKPKKGEAATEQPLEAEPPTESLRRALFLVGGGRLYILDTPDNLKALGLQP
jgi:hypothetical protein